MPRFSTACTPPIRPRITAAQLREAPAPTELAQGERVYLVGEPACVGIVRAIKANGDMIVDFALGKSEVPLFLLRRAGV